MGCQEDGFALTNKFGKNGNNGVGRIGIETAGRFISRDKDGVVRQGAGDGDALALAAGDRHWALVSVFSNPNSI